MKRTWWFVLSSLQALISDFIYVDLVSSSSCGGSGGGGGGQDSGAAYSERQRQQQQDLEVHVMAIEERWFVLCGWIEERWKTLREALRLWRALQETSARLSGWIDGAESTIKKMEQSPTEETTQLVQQVKEIMVSYCSRCVCAMGMREGEQLRSFL